MSDLIRILDIARRALHAHQSAMNTAGNNIANVNTEGYSRQRVKLASTNSVVTPYGILGSGVKFDGVERIRSKFVDKQLINERPSLNRFEFKSNALQFIEEILNEPSDIGLNRNLEDFFNSFHDLANDPESSAARTVVREKAITLSNTFNRIHRQFRNYQQQLNSELASKVKEVNRITAQIATLNQKIGDTEVGGNQAPSLRDKRDQLIDDLSQLVDVRTNENESGAVNVSVAGRFLVVGTQSQNLNLAVQSENDAGPAVTFELGGQVADITNGSIRGILDVRDSNIPNYLNQLDEFAVTLAQEVNNIHSTGYNLDGITGADFFDTSVTGAADFAVDAAVLNDANLIATSDALNEPGNNKIALAIAGLQDGLTMSDGQLTFSDFYNSFIASLGSQTQEAEFLTSSYGLTVEKLEFTRDSISGVSLDEEMTNLIEAQQAFTAATRVVTTVDEMTQSVLNMV